MGGTSIRLVLIAAYIVPFAAACSSTKACTLRGCSDTFTATLQRADGSFASGMHRIEVLADGITTTCAFMFPFATLPSGVRASPQCPSGLTVTVGMAEICHEVRTATSVGLVCDPVPGQFVETITLLGTPAQVHAWQYVDDTPILDVAAVPEYTDVFPNGPECAPICRQASASWTLE
jgi:hypothetical protein